MAQLPLSIDNRPEQLLGKQACPTRYGTCSDGQEPYYHLLQLYTHPLTYQIAEKLRRIDVAAPWRQPTEIKSIEDIAKCRMYLDMLEADLVSTKS